MNNIKQRSINGVKFTFENSAHDRLEALLERIDNAYRNEVAAEQIVEDLHARIAEFLQEKMRPGKDALTSGDVRELEERLDIPEPSVSRKQQLPLRRSVKNRYIAGVCGGLAEHFDVDALWVRGGFVAVTLIFGFGPLVYLLGWVLIPPANGTRSTGWDIGVPTLLLIGLLIWPVIAFAMLALLTVSPLFMVL